LNAILNPSAIATEIDSITLEVLRTRLAAIAEEGALTIERTACNPVIAESRDCSCTLLDSDAQLLIGGGAVAHHFGVCDHAVQSTVAMHGETIAPGDVPKGGPQVPAWPMDPSTRVVRDGSRLNQVLLLRLDPSKLDDDTRPRSAEGIVAYSAICSHAGCPVTGWVEEDGVQVLKCFCHNSEYDPHQGARVVFGPAPRHLAALPISIVDGALVAAGKFIGKVVPQQQG